MLEISPMIWIYGPINLEGVGGRRVKEKSKILNNFVDEDRIYRYVEIKSIFQEYLMNIKITETAKVRIDKALSESEFQSPAIRVLFTSHG